MRYGILGPVEVVSPDTGPVRIEGAKARAILAMLLISRNTVVSADRIADQLWHGEPPPSGVGTVHSYVSRLRRALTGPGGARQGPLVTRKPGYLLNVEPDEYDVERFEAWLREAAAADEPERSAILLRQALGLWRGPPLAEFADHEFARIEADRLAELRIGAVERRGQADLALGRHHDLIPELEQLVVEYPLREGLTELLMTALYRAGRQSDALGAYQAAYRRLTDEIGVVPGPRLRALEAAILGHDPSLTAATPAQTTVTVRPEPAPAVPAALARAGAGGPVLGRDGELARLRVAWAHAGERGCRLVVVAGAAGIGKSRLVAEFARTVAADGAAVLLGRALDRQLVPYQPVVEALGDHLAASHPQERARLIQCAGPPLGWLLPDLTADGRAHPAEPAARRYLMFEAACALLAGLTAYTGVVLVVEDLHMADRSTLALLEHLVRRARPGRLLLVATLDDAWGDPDLLADLGPDGLAERVALAGLDEPAVAALIAGTTGRPAPAGVARAVRERTRGNPMFVQELARHGLAGGVRQVPERVRDLVITRLGRLDPALAEVLQAAALAGEEFEADLVTAMLDRPTGSLEPLLDRAVTAGLVEEVTREPRRLRFAHLMVYEALRASLSGARESDLRRRLIAALTADPERDDHLAALAYHFRVAAQEDARRSVDYSRRAGDQAWRMLGFAEAAQHYQAALDLVVALPGDARRERCELLLSLGAARRANYERDATRAAYLEAVDLARALPDSAMLAKAAWGLVTVSEFTAASPDTAAVLYQALDGLDEGDTPLRVALTAGLARALPVGREAIGLARTAIAMARRLDDAESVLFALGAGILATWGPDNTDERFGDTCEVIATAHELGWAELGVEARTWRAACAEELGDVAAADADLAVVRHWAQATRQPFFRGVSNLRGAARALFEGRYAEADRLAHAAVDGIDAGPDFLSGFAAQQFGLLRDLGRLADVDAMLSDLVDSAPHVPAWRAARAVADVELGRPAKARETLAWFLADGFAGLPRDWLWLAAMGLVADAYTGIAAGDGLAPADAGPAAELYRLLLPYADRNIVLAHGVQCTGSAARHLGCLAGLLGRWPEAVDHFESAIAANRRWGAEPWLARTLLDYADAMLRRGGPEAPAEARSLVTQATEIVTRLGAAGLAPQIERLRSRCLD